MKILFVIPSLAFGGAEEQVRSIMKSSPGFACSLLVLDKKAISYAEKSLNFFCVSDSISSKFLSYLIIPFNLLKHKHKLKQFDIVHCNLTWGVWVGLWVKVFSFLRILPKTKVSVTIHYVFGLESFFSKQIHKLSFLLFDGVVFVTNDVNFARFYPKPKGLVRVIRNGIKFDSYFPLRRNAKLEKNSEVRFGVLSRLVPERNVTKAIEIFDNFFNRFSEYNSTLIIGGEGPQRRELEFFCSKLPSAKKINFAGLVLDKEKFFNHIDIFLTLSDGQYPGLSGLEAIARAVPTFGYSLKTELEESDSLIRSSNETILALSIYNLMSKDSHLEEYTRTQYQEYSTKHNLNKMIREYEVFFDSLCRLNSLS